MRDTSSRRVARATCTSVTLDGLHMQTQSLDQSHDGED